MINFLKDLERAEWVSLIGGVVLLIIAILEVIEESEEAGIELEHGLLLFALAHIIQVSIEVYERSAETAKRVIEAKNK